MIFTSMLRCLYVDTNCGWIYSGNVVLSAKMNLKKCDLLEYFWLTRMKNILWWIFDLDLNLWWIFMAKAFDIYYSDIFVGQFIADCMSKEKEYIHHFSFLSYNRRNKGMNKICSMCFSISCWFKVLKLLPKLVGIKKMKHLN